MADRFSVNQRWQVLLKDLGISPAEVLQRAGLPGDLFARKGASLSAQEYFGLWSALEASSGDPVFAIRLVENLSAEVFDPPVLQPIAAPT